MCVRATAFSNVGAKNLYSQEGFCSRRLLYQESWSAPVNALNHLPGPRPREGT